MTETEEITKVETCTGHVRWVPRSRMQVASLKLQQCWEITQYQSGTPFKWRFEWRDVPTVLDPDSSGE